MAAAIPPGDEPLPGGKAALALQKLRAAQARDGDVPLEGRRKALLALRRLVTAEADSLATAIARDFGRRSWHETMIAEISIVVAAIDYALPRLRRWIRPERVAVGWRFWPAKACVVKRPLGVIGILAPWNYPVQLTLSPLVGALAAGCRVVVKPSEHVPATSATLCVALARHLDPTIVLAIEGDADEAAAMTRLSFDKLLFTGSTETGRQVMRAAAENLVPVVLELGGKSPAIIDASADLKRAAADIIAGKLLNAGQTCIAPDYVLLPRPMMAAFVEAARAAAAHLYPDPHGPDMTSICRAPDHERLTKLVADFDTVPLFDSDTACLATPCLVIDPPSAGALMQDEIFGPILPLIPYDRPEHVFAYLDARPVPLALYWFGYDRAERDKMLLRTRSGGVAINDTVMQAAVEGLPFGGLGASGIGAYHGRAGYDAFTFERAVFQQTRASGTRLLRPPYGAFAERLIRLFCNAAGRRR